MLASECLSEREDYSQCSEIMLAMAQCQNLKSEGEIMVPSAMIPSYSGIRSPAQFQKLETESEYVKKIIKL